MKLISTVVAFQISRIFYIFIFAYFVSELIPFQEITSIWKVAGILNGQAHMLTLAHVLGRTTRNTLI